MIDGDTILIAHLGYPTTTFKAPMICNPHFERIGVNARVMPMGVKAGDYRAVLSALFKLTNFRGALVTMPHKSSTVALVDEVSPTARIAGACNAILRRGTRAALGVRDCNEASWTQVLEVVEFMRDATRLPILLDGDSMDECGVDFLGRPFSEPVLLKIAAAYEKATHHRMAPPDFGALPVEAQ